MHHDDLSLWLRLQLTPGVGPAAARRLLKAFGLPASIFSQSAAALATVVSPAQAEALGQAPEGWLPLVDTTWAWLQEQPLTRRVWALDDPDYPRLLLETEDPPLLLYAMGTATAWGGDGLNASHTVGLAVVGSRNPTPQGLVNARQFSMVLAQSGLTIVSGLALGIDGAAHEGALEGAVAQRIPTVAVVGTGLDRVYPKAHRGLAHRIAEQGVLLSEYALGTPPLAANFPQRNRIISGLSRGALVVEAALQSGSLITARLAAEQGREVFAIPGSIHATQARGCHALIKQGAKLVESAQDVLEELQLAAPTTAGAAPDGGHRQAELPLPQSVASAPAEPALLGALGFDPVDLDTLQARTGMPTAALQAGLMELELQGHAVRMPGGLFVRVVRG